MNTLLQDIRECFVTENTAVSNYIFRGIKWPQMNIGTGKIEILKVTIFNIQLFPRIHLLELMFL